MVPTPRSRTKGGSDALTPSFATNGVNGTFTIENGYNYNTSVLQTNGGIINVGNASGATSTFTVGNAFANNIGATGAPSTFSPPA